MLLTKKVDVKVTSNMCKYYKEKGYIFKCNDVITIDINDLPVQSNYDVLVECENCKKQYYMPYYSYYKCKGIVYCNDCKILKIKNTNLEKYGCEFAFQNKDVQEKHRKTIMSKYGCNNVFQNEDIKQKIKETCLKKYGVENPMQNKDILEKSYKKMCETKFYNETQICSKQQRYINDVLGGDLNRPYEKFWLDIFFEEDNIYLEYNGSGHDISVKYNKLTREQFDLNEIKRYKVLKNRGLKQIVIESSQDILSDKEVLLSLKDFAFSILKGNISSWIKFDIDNQLIKYKNTEIKYDFITPIVFDIINNNPIVTTKEGNIHNIMDKNIV